MNRNYTPIALAMVACAYILGVVWAAISLHNADILGLLATPFVLLFLLDL
jgi:hypothetical protein